MKKKGLFIITFLLICFSLCGCGFHKDTISLEQLQEIAIQKEYEYMDSTESFKEDKNIKRVGMVASNYWHLEFYEFNDVKSAEEIFESNKKSFEKEKQNTSLEEENHSWNSETYSLTTATEYMYISRIQNTLLFARVPVEYRSNVKSFVKSIQY